MSKEFKILEKHIKYLQEYDSDRVWKIRQALNINSQFSWEREADTIRQLFNYVLHSRKNHRETYFFSSTSGWTVEYLRNKKKYKEGEDFSLKIYFSFVETDTYD